MLSSGVLSTKSTSLKTGSKPSTDVAITDRYAVVGAPGENGEAGTAYVFERDGTDWSLAQ